MKRKKAALCFVLSLVMALSLALPLLAMQTPDDYTAIHCVADMRADGCYTQNATAEIVDIIDIGNGYLVYILSVDEDKYEIITPFSISRCSCGHFRTAATQEFHTIRHLPPPSTCTSRTFVTTWTCSVCWHSEVTTTHQGGCGSNCPVLR